FEPDPEITEQWENGELGRSLEHAQAVQPTPLVADLTNALHWALRRIRTSLDTGDLYANAEAVLNRAGATLPPAQPSADAEDAARYRWLARVNFRLSAELGRSSPEREMQPCTMNEHCWSVPSADGVRECLWCNAIDRVAVANAPRKEPEEEPCGKATLAETSMDTKTGYDTTQQLLRLARKDADKVSCFAVGSGPDDTDEAIFVVKGKRLVQEVFSDLEAKGLISRNPVRPNV